MLIDILKYSLIFVGAVAITPRDRAEYGPAVHLPQESQLSQNVSSGVGLLTHPKSKHGKGILKGSLTIMATRRMGPYHT